MTRREVLGQAADQCMKELYSYVQPSVEWEDFVKQNREYKEGPKPYEFYYLPKEILKDLYDEYVYAYRINQQGELLNTIETLKNYCKNPTVDKYIEEYTDENGDWHPGHRSYDRPESIIKAIEQLIPNSDSAKELVAKKIWNKVEEYLDMAGNFYKWNGELNSFGQTIYLGASPNSNKEAVIENWKKYRNQDIKIDEEQIEREFYGENYD